VTIKPWRTIKANELARYAFEWSDYQLLTEALKEPK
jgi:hypothetical protein